MFFYLNASLLSQAPVTVQEVSANHQEFNLKNTLYLQKGEQYCHRKVLQKGELILLGDPVFPKESLDWNNFITGHNEPNQDALFLAVRGHYHYFYVSDNALFCGSSLSAIYPIYYSKEDENLLVSSSAFALAEQLSNPRQDRSNLLERLLFNYTFFNTTWWEGIELLDAQRYLRIAEGRYQLAGTFEISDYFGKPSSSSRSDLRDLMPVFQEEIELFFPDQPFGISFTGGFDGRTLVAAARKAQKPFSTYSFGRPSSSDIQFPLRQSPALGIPYNPIYLDEKYLKESALANAQEFVAASEYNGNFGRPHYTYAAKQLSRDVKFILTGNFGSELFRALHEPGVMISQSTVDVFHSEGERWKDKLKAATEGWDGVYFKDALDQLIARMEAYLAPRKDWDANHRFYHFVFNDLFRKYFGPELIMQSQYFNNRTPYLSLSWIQTLNQTIWSGVHARLFEKKLNKRMKGQMFYSSFLRYADRQMYYQTTNKAYSSADVLERWRLPLLVGKVVIHKYIKEREDNENASQDFFGKYHKQIADQWEMNQIPECLQRELHRSFQEIPKGKSMDQWIKLYSIMQGWNAARLQAPIMNK